MIHIAVRHIDISLEFNQCADGVHTVVPSPGIHRSPALGRHSHKRARNRERLEQKGTIERTTRGRRGTLEINQRRRIDTYYRKEGDIAKNVRDYQTESEERAANRERSKRG